MGSGERFESLDAGRGICAILVVVFHFIAEMDSDLRQVTFFRNSYLFVDFFFVLSGFVLCHSYRGRIASPQDFWRLVVKRVGRVWPLHATVLVAFIAAIVTIGLLPHPKALDLTWHTGSYTVQAIVPSAFLLTAFGLQGSVWNGPAWSIGAEFYTYLLFALVMMFWVQRLVTVALTLSVAALAVLYWPAPALMNSTWDYGFIRCIAGFFAGIVTYRVYGLVGTTTLLRATMSEVAVIAAIVLFVSMAGENGDNVSPLSLAAPLVFGWAVVVFAGQHGLLSLLLLTRPFRALGRYSFSIYMIHMPMLIVLCYGAWYFGYRTLAFQDGGEAVPVGSSGLLMADFVLAVIVAAAACYRFIETPARLRFNRMADGKGRGPREALARA